MNPRLQRLLQIAENPLLTKEAVEDILWAVSLLRKMFVDQKPIPPGTKRWYDDD